MLWKSYYPSSTILLFPLYCYLAISGAPWTRVDCPPGEIGLFPSDEGCNSEYWFCYLGEAHPQTCPGETVFDPTNHRCVLQNESSCAETSTIELTQLGEA